MAEVLLFHHALGLTDGMREFADSLRSAGHDVTTPDLFDGLVFDSIADGVAHAASIGFGAIADSGEAFAADCGDRLVVAGFSLGAMPAQKLAQTRPGVAGAILYHAAIPASEFGDGWPDGVALQLHLAEHDEWSDEDLVAAPALAAEAGGELFLYPVAGHLVADSSFSDYDPDVAATILERTLTFLDAIG